ncbi:Topoisomerase 1-associated factor 1 [Entophlyctis luteolus]|nr:Topoisomerase 1-associated factor 1 [Entophlyctis luteolus]
MNGHQEATAAAAANQLLNICTALGGFEGDKYIPGDEAIECLRDIKKLLRIDVRSSSRYTFDVLGEWNFVARDLVPFLLVTDVATSYKTALLIVELMVPLTWPYPVDPADPMSPNEIATLLKYKECFVSVKVLEKIVAILLVSVAIPFRDRSEKENAKIRLILSLFRNLLAIKDPQASVVASGDSYFQASLQERLVGAFHQAKVFELILTFASSMEEKEFRGYNMLILEIVHLIFRGRTVYSILVESKVVQSENLLKLAKKEIEAKSMRKISMRHSRFGGALSLNLGNGKEAPLFNAQMALNSKQSALDSGKTTGRAKLKGQNDSFTHPVIRNESAKVALRQTADTFLEHGFNALITCVKDDFDKERQHVTEDDQARFLSVVAFFLEYQVEVSKVFYSQMMKFIQSFYSQVSDEIEAEKFDFDTVTDFINARAIQFVTKRMKVHWDEKNWDHLQTAMECLKQMLVTLNAMEMSGNEDYRHASQTIQNNLYYEAYALEAIVQLCKGFKEQSAGYLKTLVETVHIFLKMLEKYSKSKAFMVVRRKRKQLKKKKISREMDMDGSNEIDLLMQGDDEEGQEDPEQVKQKCVEHEFHFEKIENDFAHEAVVMTYSELLKRYRELEPKYLHYATTLFHRIFVKAKMEPLLYKLSTFDLFNRIIADEKILEPTKEYGELKEFIRYVLKRFFAKSQEYPLLFIEILFSKTRGDCRRIQNGFENDIDLNDTGNEDAPEGKSMKQLPAELELRRDLSWTQKVGVVVTLLSLTFVATKRMAEEQANSIIDDFNLTQFAQMDNSAVSSVVAEVLRSNNNMHLLLELMKAFKRVDGDEIQWFLGKDRTADDVLSDCKFIRFFIEEPLDDNSHGTPLHKLVRKKIQRKKKIKLQSDNDDNGLEEPAKQKKAKEKLVPVYLSAQFVYDSDDDENDNAFFEAERQQRLKTASLAEAQLRLSTSKSHVEPSIPLESDAGATVSSENASSGNTKRKTRRKRTVFGSDSESSAELDESTASNSGRDSLKLSNIVGALAKSDMHEKQIVKADDDAVEESTSDTRKRRNAIFDSDSEG